MSRPQHSGSGIVPRIDITSLVFARVAFGAIMLWEIVRYIPRINRYYIDPGLHFTYHGFGWIHPWPGEGMYFHFYALGALAIAIVAGFFYRVATALFFLGFTYVFLLDQANYLNHFYLVCLLSFLLIFVPANRAFSIDARQRPELRSDRVPAWPLWLLRAQLFIVYLYAGIAKLNADWLAGEPMRMWLSKRSDYWLVGPLFTQEWVVYAMSWGGLLLDLLAGPLLLWRRTRAVMFCVVAAFHLANATLFDIGIFPWLMLAMTTLFFDPDWPRRLLRGPSLPEEPVAAATPGLPRLGRFAVVIFLSVQLLVPLRHFLYPGNVSWTEEGHRFAWHMKLRSKAARAVFVVVDPVSEKSRIVMPDEHLTRRQVSEMAGRPDMLLQFAHYLAAEYEREHGRRPLVMARVLVSLNGRRPRLLLDSSRDLAAVPRSLAHADWIHPLEGTPRS